MNPVPEDAGAGTVVVLHRIAGARDAARDARDAAWHAARDAQGGLLINTLARHGQTGVT